MPRKTYIRVGPGKFIEKPARVIEHHTMVTPDIPAYQSMVTFREIDGRKAHREHLKEHSLVEVGSEKLW